MKKQVFLIRKITRDKVAATSDFLGVSESFVIKVMDLIEENPDLDDEEIAEILVDFKSENIVKKHREQKPCRI